VTGIAPPSLKTKLLSAGVALHFEFENAELGVKLFFVRDPNMNLVAFVERL
jgi:hypothetical protein